MDLKVSGRRNMLGACLGRRRCSWFASTSKFLAHLTRSNTNMQCPYRLPLTTTTHDPDCKRKSCLESISNRKLTLIAQRAMKTITGYFGGYISKNRRLAILKYALLWKLCLCWRKNFARKNLNTAAVSCRTWPIVCLPRWKVKGSCEWLRKNTCLLLDTKGMTHWQLSLFVLFDKIGRASCRERVC